MPRTSLLPQLEGATLLTDSGVETDIIFGAGRDLPAFALYPLLADDEGRFILRRYYEEHLAVAARYGLGYLLETPTWRSNRDWGGRLGYAQDQLDDFDRAAVDFLRMMRDAAPAGLATSPISGLIGPRGDGYVVREAMTEEDAEDYHVHQVAVFASAGCDLVSGCTFTYASEAIGLVRAGKRHAIPVVVYFTVETDGRLPDGSSLEEAITTVDAATAGSAAYFGINCAHPEHIAPALDPGGPWTSRIGALRSNASRLSHAELDVAEELDSGDPAELAAEYRVLARSLPGLRVFGGCCGTDVRHLGEIAAVVTAQGVRGTRAQAPSTPDLPVFLAMRGGGGRQGVAGFGGVGGGRYS